MRLISTKCEYQDETAHKPDVGTKSITAFQNHWG